MWRGSNNQVKWALDIRHERIREARKALLEEEDADRRSLLAAGLYAMERIRSSRWWIDNRDAILMALARKAVEYEEETRAIGLTEEEGFAEEEGVRNDAPGFTVR